MFPGESTTRNQRQRGFRVKRAEVLDREGDDHFTRDFITDLAPGLNRPHQDNTLDEIFSRLPLTALPWDVSGWKCRPGFCEVAVITPDERPGISSTHGSFSEPRTHSARAYSRAVGYNPSFISCDVADRRNKMTRVRGTGCARSPGERD
jgi:hypothetical protein